MACSLSALSGREGGRRRLQDGEYLAWDLPHTNIGWSKEQVTGMYHMYTMSCIPVGISIRLTYQYLSVAVPEQILIVPTETQWWMLYHTHWYYWSFHWPMGRVVPILHHTTELSLPIPCQVSLYTVNWSHYVKGIETLSVVYGPSWQQCLCTVDWCSLHC